MKKQKKHEYIYSNIDMKEFYRGIMCYYTAFPEVIVVEDIENNSDIIAYKMPNGNLIYYLKHSDDMLDVFLDELQNPRAKILIADPKQCHDLSDEEVFTWICCAVEIADILNIKCPQVIFWCLEDSGNSNDGRIFIADVHPNNRLNIVTNFVTIAHELRHEWQHINCPNISKDYVHPESDEDMETYLIHPSEIDAEAFARQLAVLIFGINLFPTGTEILKERAEEIEIDEEKIDYEIFEELFEVVHS